MMKFIGDFTTYMKRYADEKIRKLDKYVDVTNATIVYKALSTKDKCKVEISLNEKTRASKIGEDYYDLLLEVIDKLESQIKRFKSTEFHKCKFLKDDEYPEMDIEYKSDISKEKVLILDSTTHRDAIEDMELLGHTFYLYRDIDRDNKICAIYKRADDSYGLIECR